MRIGPVRQSNATGRDGTGWGGECETRLCGQAERVLDCRSPLCPTHPPIPHAEEEERTARARGIRMRGERRGQRHPGRRKRGGEERGGILGRGARESDPPAIFNEASIKRKLRACAQQWPSDPVSFPRESSLGIRTAAFSHPRVPRDPARTVGLRIWQELWSTNSFFSLYPSPLPHSIKCLII